MKDRSDPETALRQARKRVRLWFKKNPGNHSLAGMDADDLTQETVLALLKARADLRYSWNKAKFILADALREEMGGRRMNKIRPVYDGSEIVEDKHLVASMADPQDTENLAVELVESSQLPDRAKSIAAMMVRGGTVTEVAKTLGITTGALCNYLSAHAGAYHDLAGLPMSKEIERRMLKVKSRTRTGSRRKRGTSEPHPG